MNHSTPAADLGLDLDVLSEEVDRKLFDLVAATGKTIEEILPQQAGLFAKDVVKLTPPFKSLSGNESWAEQKKVGARAVDLEIRRAFKPLDQLGVFKNPHKLADKRENLDLLINGHALALATFLQRCGYLEVKADKIVDGPSEGLHNPLRDSRGKVRRKGASYFVRTERELKAFVKQKQALVGKLKAGWAAAASALGVSIPAWIRRHSTPGSIEDRSRASLNPFIRIVNAASYGAAQDADIRFVAIALRNRIGKIERQLEAKIKGLWEGRGA